MNKHSVNCVPHKSNSNLLSERALSRLWKPSSPGFGDFFVKPLDGKFASHLRLRKATKKDKENQEK